MDLKLSGKKVVVTGGSKGIGCAIAEEFLKEGAVVVVTGRNQTDLDAAVHRLSKYGTVEGIVADGTDESAIYEAAKKAAGTEGAGSLLFTCWVS